MFKIEPKCTSYDVLCKRQKTISDFKKFLIFVIIASIVLLVIFAMKENNLMYIFVVLPIISIIIIFSLKGKFKKNNKKIYDVYCNFNNFWPEKSRLCTYISDNKSALGNLFINDVQGSNTIWAFVENENLAFISKTFEMILNCKKYSKRYMDILNSDYGKIVIPFKNIDSYRYDSKECTLITSEGNNILRIKFTDAEAFDFLIPQYEYYFSVSKKEDK